MKLISMTEYVIEQGTIDIKGNTPVDRVGRYVNNTMNYAQFLQQPLTLGMFVPCVDGVPILHPIIKTIHSDDCECIRCVKMYKNYSIQENQYQQAKEKVIFEGFECVDKYPEYISVTQNGTRRFLVINGEFETYGNNNIESIVKFNPTLTKSALKQINL